MEWIDGVRCTDLEGLGRLNVPISSFIKTGVQSGMRQLLEFGLFHGDPHPGNVFALGDGRIAYVDFGSVAEISKANKESLIDAVVHAMDEVGFGAQVFRLDLWFRDLVVVHAKR